MKERESRSRGEYRLIRFGDLEISGTEPVFGDLVFCRTGTDPNLRKNRTEISSVRFGESEILGRFGFGSVLVLVRFLEIFSNKIQFKYNKHPVFRILNIQKHYNNIKLNPKYNQNIINPKYN